EERRLAYVGLTRARRRAKVSFAQNRRTRGLYQSAIPSRFVDDLPEGDVEVMETKSPFGGAYQNFGNPFESGGFGRNPYGKSRFDQAEPRFSSTYDTPGWQRAKTHEETRQANWSRDADRQRQASMKPLRPPITIEGELVASSSAK